MPSQCDYFSPDQFYPWLEELEEGSLKIDQRYLAQMAGEKLPAPMRAELFS